MADLLIRNIDPKLEREIARRARAHGRSVSEEVTSLRCEALSVPKRPQKPTEKMGTWLFNLLPAEYRGDDLVFEVPGEMCKPPDFE